MAPGMPVHLADATVQQMQLELIRRRRFNRFDGGRILNDLLDQRRLWEAVMLDAPEPLSMIKLRDMSANLWNTDTLFILAVDEESAQRLAGNAEAWLADTVDVLDARETQAELGMSDSGARRLVTMWWD
jgi:hypothetical protein